MPPAGEAAVIGALSAPPNWLNWDQKKRVHHLAGAWVDCSRKEAEMKTVRQLLRSKGGEVFSITPEASVFEALKLMAEKNVGALLVVADCRIAGILSERDYARKVILHGKSSHDIPVREIMSEKVVTVPPDQTVEDCMALMTDRRIRHLPVVEGERLLGLLSIGDLVKDVIAEQERTIRELESYIHS